MTKRKRPSNKALAEAIAKRLFVNCNGDLAIRLELKRWNEDRHEEDVLGGWGFISACKQIEAVLKKARSKWRRTGRS